jgi:hypothetical protein
VFLADGYPQSTRFGLSAPVDLAQTLAFARMGNGDPCLRVVDGSVWRATRTPAGVATERLRVASDGSIEIDAWGPGAESSACSWQPTGARNPAELPGARTL